MAKHRWNISCCRFWKAMHDTVTRNHRCKTLGEFVAHVIRLLYVVQPFSGNQQALAKLNV